MMYELSSYRIFEYLMTEIRFQINRERLEIMIGFERETCVND